MDNTNLDVLRQRSHHRTSKPVGRSQSGIGTAQRSRSLAPLTYLPALLREVHCGHQQKTRTRALQILSLRTGCTLHVRLAETQEDIEIRIYLRLHLQGRQHQNHRQQKGLFHLSFIYSFCYFFIWLQRYHISVRTKYSFVSYTLWYVTFTNLYCHTTRTFQLCSHLTSFNINGS